MKKSKLLIPAVGFLMISLAAAGTSTVAWFSSTAAATASLNNIMATKVDDGLKVYSEADDTNHSYAVVKTSTETASAPSSTTAVAFYSAAAASPANAKKASLRDASLAFDTSSKTPTVYIPSVYGTDGNPTYFKALTKTTTDTSSLYMTPVSITDNAVTIDYSVYTYAKFSLTFSVGNATDDATKAVYMNMLTTATSLSTGTDTDPINKAVRFAYATTVTGSTAKCNTQPVVYAPNYTASTDALTASGAESAKGLSYIAAAGDSSSSYYNDVALVGYTGNAYGRRVTSPDTASRSGFDYLGDIKGGTTPITLKVTFFVWFEGTDSNCVDSSLTGDTDVVTGDTKEHTFSKTLTGNFSFYALDKVGA